MDSFPAYIEAVGWTVWLGSVLLLQQGSIQFWSHDKKFLLFILDRLQKCANLVSFLAGHEVIEHPMDFGTFSADHIKPMSNEQRRRELNSQTTEFVPCHHKPFGVAC
ncbi:unnamed protein product [Musa textilis]